MTKEYYVNLINNFLNFETYKEIEEFSPCSVDDGLLDQLWGVGLKEYWTGATKLVLDFGEDFVIKIPFFVDEYGESLDIYDDTDIKPWDYCEREANCWYEAKERGLEKYFAKTEFIGYYQHILPLYIQPRCIPFFSEYSHQLSEEQIEEIYNINNKSINYCFRIAEEALIFYIINNIPQNDLNKLCEFIGDMDINDIVGRNVGFLKDTKNFVFFDYSGFYD